MAANVSVYITLVIKTGVDVLDLGVLDHSNPDFDIVAKVHLVPLNLLVYILLTLFQDTGIIR